MRKGLPGLRPIVLAGATATPEGTAVLKEGFHFNPLEDRVGPSLIAAGGTLFFQADDVRSGMELWKSDGTPEGWW